MLSNEERRQMEREVIKLTPELERITATYGKGRGARFVVLVSLSADENGPGDALVITNSRDPKELETLANQIRPVDNPSVITREGRMVAVNQDGTIEREVGRVDGAN